MRTFRAGVGAAVGHDLTIVATRWRGRAEVDPSDLAACSVRVRVDVDGLEVRSGEGGAKPLTDSDKRSIEGSIRGLLAAERHPEIEFASTGVAEEGDALAVSGTLSIVGVARPVRLVCHRDGNRVRGAAEVVQSEWGIRPYSAFFGALRVKDEVTVEFDVALSD
ncbi:YceI family protein [Saccharopolyspora erythraea]|uniref:YceI family protein n=1 Tax=Saccharopolyspora erythraea TaxID=1836 RepID=UPI0020137DA1|nr:YceI family protein [Saccharopolyspora erythraea]